MKPGSQVSRERILYEAKTAALAGRQILKIRYWDIHHLLGDPRRWDYQDWHHTVTGVEMLTDRGPSCIVWASTFFPYGVEVFHAPMSDRTGTGESTSGYWDVSGSDRWRSRLGPALANVQTFWERFTISPTDAGGARASDACEVDVPVALRVDFAAGPVWMVAGIPQGPTMQEVFVPGDEIMVVFTAERMRHIGFPASEFLAAGPD